jgi:hypothetical protein
LKLSSSGLIVLPQDIAEDSPEGSEYSQRVAAHG